MENGETAIGMLCHVIIGLWCRSRECTPSWTSNNEEEYTEVTEKYRRRRRMMRSVPYQCWNKANCKDMISWFNQFFNFLGLFLFKVCVEFWYRPIRDSFCPSDFSFLSDSLHSSFISTSRTTLGQTSGHLDFSSHPINFRIVLS